MPDLLKNNHLDDPALTLVRTLDDIDEIWKRLRQAYGDTRMLLNKKLASVKDIGVLWRMKDTEGIKNGLSKLIYLMTDLKSLAERHNIENNLYHSDGINVIYHLLGDHRVTKWFDSICNEELNEKDTWTKLISFLEKELQVQQKNQ